MPEHKNATENNTGKKKAPFAVHAARWSVILPLGTIVINFMINGFREPRPRTFFLVLGVVYLVAYGSGIALAIAALCGIRLHGPKGIRGPAIAGLILNILSVAFLACLVPALTKVRAFVEQNTDSRMRDTIAILQADVLQMQKTGNIPIRTFTVEEHGAMAPVLQLVHENMVRQANLSREFQNKTGHIDIASCLDPSRLIDASAVADSRQQILTLQQSYQEFVSKVTEHGITTCKEVNTLPLSRAFKNGFIEGYMDKKLQEGKILEHMKQLHFDYTQAILELLSFMEAKSDVCSLQDGYLVFEQKADEEEFNKLFTTIVQCEEQLNTVAAQAQEGVQESMQQTL